MPCQMHVERQIKVLEVRGAVGRNVQQPGNRLASAGCAIGIHDWNGIGEPVVTITIRAKRIALNLDLGRSRRIAPVRTVHR